MAKSYDPIAPVAEEISEEACLLCFDEFQVIISLISATQRHLNESDSICTLFVFVSFDLNFNVPGDWYRWRHDS